MSAKWNLFVDLEKCTGCRNCFIAVKDEYVGNAVAGVFAPQPIENATWFSVEHHERGRAPFTQVTHLPKTCRHCDTMPCAVGAPSGAVVKRPDGIVVIDPVKARGARSIVAACPHGAVLWNDDLELPQAWPFDAHLLDGGWTRTRVEQVCPTGALKSEKLEDAARDAKAAREGWRALPGEAESRPRVLYRGLERLETVLVAGTVTGAIEGRTECLEGVRVDLVVAGGGRTTCSTDAFGDFRFERATPGGRAVLRVSHPGRATVEREVAPGDGVVQCFHLEPAPV